MKPVSIRRIVLCCCLLLAVTAVKADTLTITLDDVVAAECGAEFSELGITMSFEETTAEDIISPYCLFIADANNFGEEGVYIYPARLVVDLSGVEDLESVEVDVYETHFAGSTRAFLYSGETLVASEQSYMEDMQTLTLNPGAAVDWMAISAQESYVFEIRLMGENISPLESGSWSALKAAYR